MATLSTPKEHLFKTGRTVTSVSPTAFALPKRMAPLLAQSSPAINRTFQ
jgi:hypothetical protein